MRHVFLSTQTLERHLSDDVKTRALVLVEVFPDRRQDDTFELAIECTFQAVRFRGGGDRPFSYYAACEGGQIDLHVEAVGEMVEWSPPIELPTQYRVITQHAQKAAFAIKPTLEIGRPDKSSLKVSGPGAYP